MKRPALVIAFTLLIALSLSLMIRNSDNSDTAMTAGSLPVLAEYGQQGVIAPLPPVPALPPNKVALGRKLFHDPRLSGDNSISCASCHDLSAAGVDRRQFPVGIRGQNGNINTPTVFNASLNIAQFWDGRAKTLEDQALGPIHNPVEMGSNLREVIGKLNADKEYPHAFRQIYPDGINAANISDAIANFERTLLTHNSRFDRHLLGEKGSVTPDEIEGYQRFVNYGCASCHQGAGVGGNMFQRFGVMDDFFRGREITKADLGRFNVTGDEADRHVFKVPSLRNVAATAPYFHDGSAATLEKAIEVMGLFQLGKALSSEDVRLIASFLRSLNGEWEGQLLQ